MRITLKQARGFRELSQREVAEHLGIDRTTYLKIEADPSRATIAQAKAIADLLGFDPASLFLAKDATNSCVQGS